MNSDIEHVGGEKSGGTADNTGETEEGSVPSPAEVVSGEDGDGGTGGEDDDSGVSAGAAFVGFLLAMAFWGERGL